VIGVASNNKTGNRKLQAPPDAPRVVLVCVRCRADLSRPIVLFHATDPGIVPPQLSEKRHVMNAGCAFVSDTSYRQSYGDPRKPLDFTPQVWMTLRDVLPTVLPSPDMMRGMGCCGPDGTNGPNRLCTCGAEIGTEISDCWTSWLFIPEPGATDWRSAN
jgi:hypothetical protein